MEKTTVYVPPSSEEYTGYTTFTVMSTSTSEAATFLSLEETFEQPSEEEHKKEYYFPESREERFLDKDLREFYRKKGYEI